MKAPPPGQCVGCGDWLPQDGLCGACVMAETSKRN